MSRAKKITYPLSVKSTAYLQPGQFWAIPLESGTFACGRVIQLWSLSRRYFLFGLMDWVGASLPDAEALAGYVTVEQGCVRIEAIHMTGGVILGHRPLELDGIAPQMFCSQSSFAPHCMLKRGFDDVRPATRQEWEKYPTFSFWGYGLVPILAERYFGAASQRSASP